ncbi:unannotated protein [freshwater metagenome]|uniref:Unannotated protein n=1 Tax=freshwater metagenome TaxID=449393 RepID=A0A6J7HPG5_9ZZZZ|nr:hypothetical protein [Actinomycetota bacterium]
MGKLSLPSVALILVLTLAVAATALASGSRWRGSSTNLKGDFTYGKVSFTLSGSTIRDFVIEGVTTSGCGGFKSVVVPRIRLKGSVISVKYRPIEGIDDWIVIAGRIRGGKATGTFREGPLCSNEGRFTARRR